MRTGPRALIVLALCSTAAAAGLTGCGGPARDGYAAAGAVAPGPERVAGDNVAPQAPVEFQPLSAPSAAGGSASSERTSPGAPEVRPPAGSGQGGAAATGPGAPPPPATTPGAGPATPPSTTPGTPPGTPGTPPAGTPGTTPPPAPAPARLVLGPLTRAAAADRWCERVTVAIANTGGTAARSGSVGFETHVIGALGIDWATVTTAQPLPAPLAAGTTKTQTYTVCVESWRVPLGMHVETRRATATWS